MTGERTWLLILATIAVTGAIAVGLLAIATAHRDRCIKAGNVGCTILPWSGHR
jgi:hypothetical protein